MHEERRSLRRVNAIAVLLLFVQLYGCSSGGPSDDQGAYNQAAAVAPVSSAETDQTSASSISADAKLIVAFGDSLYAGYRLDPTEGFAPALQRALEKRGVKAHVVNAGVSGETTADGLRRLAFTLDGLPRKPDLVIVGLGGNDMLRGLQPTEARANLDGILSALKQRGTPAMLTGMLASRNLGSEYAAAFDRIYPDLAKKYEIPLYPFFLDGVVGHRELMLDDGLHPNAKGVDTIADKVAPIAAGELAD